MSLRQIPVTPRLSAAILALLRGEMPPADGSPEAMDDCLRRYECGGYLWMNWSATTRPLALPPGWSAALKRSHQKTLHDNLAALAEFRRVGTLLREEGVEFALLKGAAYLGDLYQDLGARRMTDIDLLIRQRDAGRAARRLARAGFRGEVSVVYPGNRRFEMWFASEAACRFEFHWGLGASGARVDPGGLWERSRPGILEDIPCRRLDPRDAVPYHAGHLAEHYFGPSLKWVLDLREMLKRWRPDPGAVAEACRAWRSRTALGLALTHLERLFPDEALTEWTRLLAPSAARRALLAIFRSDQPLDLFRITNSSRWRYALRCLTLDGGSDGLRLAGQAIARKGRRILRPGGTRPPWEWRDTDD